MGKEEKDEKEMIKFLKIINEFTDKYLEFDESAFFISLAPN